MPKNTDTFTVTYKNVKTGKSIVVEEKTIEDATKSLNLFMRGMAKDPQKVVITIAN